MREIFLTRGMVAIVDDEDYERIAAFKWYANPNASGTIFYARRVVWFPRDGGKRASINIPMHRAIVEAPDDIRVDHFDGNGLNNRRSNLRMAAVNQNAWNSRLSARNKTGFKGVHLSKKSGLYEASLHIAGKGIWCGGYTSPESAARAYDAAAILHFGEFACLNFPPSQEYRKCQ